jgi:hypothetical protein
VPLLVEIEGGWMTDPALTLAEEDLLAEAAHRFLRLDIVLKEAFDPEAERAFGN